MGVEGAVGDLVADTDQLAQGCALANDLRIGLDVGDRRRVLGQFAQVAQAAGLAALAFLVQLLVQGYHVERGVLIGQLVDRAENQAVVMPIEIAVGDLIEHTLPGAVVQHQATEHSLFGLDGMRRHLEGSGLQVVLLGCGDFVHGHLESGGTERQRARPVNRIVPDVNRLAGKPPDDQVLLKQPPQQRER
ncbi:hypothetical protein D3C85_1346140 [compost metagenome]